MRLSTLNNDSPTQVCLSQTSTYMGVFPFTPKMGPPAFLRKAETTNCHSSLRPTSAAASPELRSPGGKKRLMEKPAFQVTQLIIQELRSSFGPEMLHLLGGRKHTTATVFGSQHFTYSYQTRQILQACQDTFFHDFNMKRFRWTPI